MLPVFELQLTSAQQVQKATWYRYYDSKGVANISTNVTPNHIRYGYEALDQNMQVIKRNRPYNAEADVTPSTTTCCSSTSARCPI